MLRLLCAEMRIGSPNCQVDIHKKQFATAYTTHNFLKTWLSFFLFNFLFFFLGWYFRESLSATLLAPLEGGADRDTVKYPCRIFVF